VLDFDYHIVLMQVSCQWQMLEETQMDPSSSCALPKRSGMLHFILGVFLFTYCYILWLVFSVKY